mmetsp:Transcript_106721/g.311987  ORF Transcript_106721/g.311987 Transcript_106721/m.311987 type:complete len:1437 (-) Transcript_106721:107-4417(-)
MMRRSCLWLAATVAVLRCGWPFVWLSAGEAPSSVGAAARASPVEVARQTKWWLRNSAILRLTSPCCIIVGDDVDCDALPHLRAHTEQLPPVMSLEELMHKKPLHDHAVAQIVRARRTALHYLPGEGSTLCYMFTGGSTGSPKCVEITHAMALHETRGYPSLAPLSPADRVLQNTSVFWAASAWGQLDIALAFASTLCISAVAAPSTHALHDASISVLGSSPSVLSQLAPEELPCMRCAFSWGEAMPPSVAARWRSAGIRLVELLISTEYWLGFYCDGPLQQGGNAIFKVVDGLDFAVLPLTEGSSTDLLLEPGAIGELCVRGPAVMRGYKPSGEECIRTDAGRYYRTKDVVKVLSVPGGYAIEFHGRSDALIKVGAEFVNLADVETRLECLQQCGGVSACVLPPRSQGRGPTAHAFLAARRCEASRAEVVELLGKARRILPRGAALHVVDALPRDETTGKVDRRALAEQLKVCAKRSIPLGQAEQCSMLWRLLRRYPATWACLLLLCSLDLLLDVCISWSGDHDSCMGLWLAGVLRLLLLPYVWLCSLHMLPCRCTDIVPFGRLGVVAGCMACGFWRDPLAAEVQLGWSPWIAAAVIGLSLAAYDGRAASWPIAFWLGAPHTLAVEAAWWLKPDAWRWWIWEGLPYSPRRLREAWREAPQFETARRYVECFHRACSRSKAPSLVGRRIRVWSVTQQTWLKAEIIKAHGSWLTVKYAWPDGQVYEKSLWHGDEQLSFGDPFMIRYLRCPNWLSWSVQRALGFICPPRRQYGRAEESRPTVEVAPSEDSKGLPEPAGAGTAMVARGALSNTDDSVELKYRGYYLREWIWWERYWWDTCTVDTIDVSMPDEATVDLEVALESETHQATNAFEARLLRLVERHLHPGVAHLATPLLGADSISFMAFCRAVRTELHQQLEPEVAMSCETPAHLLQHLESNASQAAVCPTGPLACQGIQRRDTSYRVYFAPSQWKGKCAWLYETKGLLEPERFRAAVARLVERHQALRYTFIDPPEMVPFLQVPAGLLVAASPVAEEVLQKQAWPAMLKRLLTCIMAGLQRLASFGLKGSWPQVGPKACNMDSAVRIGHCSSWNDVLQGIHRQSRTFEQPFSMGLYLMQPAREGAAAEEARSYVYIVCTHAFSDGYTCFPLINDLAEFCEAEPGRGPGAPRAAALPSAFGVLQQRLFHALDMRPLCAAPDQCSLRCTEFFLPRREREPAQYNHLVQFGCDSLAALRRCSRDYAVPLDMALLGVVAAALLRTGVSDAEGRLTGQAPGEQRLTMALYAPMRDGAGNEDMVGLFSDWRELTLAGGGGLSVVGLLLQIMSTIRGRQWTKFDALQNSERILVNILPLDERPRGSCGFRQTRSHEYNREQFQQQRKRFWSQGALRPMRLTLEQFELETWWLSLDLSDDCFPPVWCRHFVANLERTILDLIHKPLVPVM